MRGATVLLAVLAACAAAPPEPSLQDMLLAQQRLQLERELAAARDGAERARLAEALRQLEQRELQRRAQRAASVASAPP